MIHPLGDPAHHFWLTRSVARVMGLNLSDAMKTGQLTEQDFASMVTRCRGCHHVADCQEWLSRPHDKSEGPMPACCNAGALQHLQHRH
jgi:hypothetical protein